MTNHQARRRIRVILLHEPSWFAEAMSALGIFVWAAGAFLTNDVSIKGADWIMPVLGIVIGPVRIVALFMLHSLSRVVGGMLGAAFWGFLTFALIQKFGFIQSIGPVLALTFGDLLTIGKFSFEAIENCREGDD